jgi:Gpi18-like mannosyltransferase
MNNQTSGGSAAGGPSLRWVLGRLSDRVKKSAGTWEVTDVVIVVVGCALALGLRYTLRGFTSGDYERYTSKWYDFIRANGGFAALRFNFSNYTPPYLYLLAISGAFFSSLHKVTAIKLVSIPFDFVCAYYVAKFVRLRYSSSAAAVASFLIILFTPTVFMNGSFWGQIDIIYATGLVITAYYLSRGNDVLALLVFGVALSFKLQAVFLVPLLAALALSKAVRWRAYLLIPLAYFVMMVPAWIAGRPIGELMTLYVTQGTADELLSLNAPTVFTWLPDYLFDTLYPAGLIWAGAAVLIFVLVVSKSRLPRTAGLIVELSTISVLVTPYILPKMHERYFFPADVFTIIFAAFYPKYLIVPVLVQFVSLFSYFPFLFGYNLIPLRTLAMIELVPVVLVIYHFVSRLTAGETSKTTELEVS